ncbi:acetate kinase [Secundilactobacillus oryzae JCM 18671]|uniref:Acetate kinase n=1 Tax=Secundilactobacillus oryzae JCM 18671 TaxID=1291743 RepID=A0A081BGA8_9LACO|nr:acetate/propionate family kinase [Secundilactobacillus oryzae]GAK47076.1 acetate kinase [Secundilactobacillus oryzae JCM 18671]
MKKYLVINAGSSSLKWKLFDIPAETVIAEGLVERINLEDSIVKLAYRGNKSKETVERLSMSDAVKSVLRVLVDRKIISRLSDIHAVGHRIVAGAEQFKSATKLDQRAIASLKQLSDYAPLHNPMQVATVELLATYLPNAPQFAVFDSQLYLQMADETALFGIPYELSKEFHIRRYGEHGISHEYLACQTATLMKRPLNELNIVTLHLGSGASVSAFKNGKIYDTSMGLTPVTGVLMGTRSGDVDPAIVPFLMKRLQLDSSEAVLALLNEKSGLHGVSGISSDMRDLVASDSERANLALQMFENQVVKQIGAYFAEMGGIDAITFAGGIGEKDSDMRRRIMTRVSHLGVRMDPNLNDLGVEGRITIPTSPIMALIVPTNEELAIVRQVAEQLKMDDRELIH